MLHCYDSVVAGALPPSPVVLGYVDGAWPTYWDLAGRRFVVPITVTGLHEAVLSGGHGRPERAVHPVVVDCERGDLTPAQAASWALETLRQGRRPTVYGGQESIDEVVGWLRAHHVRADLCDYFLADWNQVGDAKVRWPRFLPEKYLCGWQFAAEIPRPGGHSVDASIVRTRWARRHGLR